MGITETVGQQAPTARPSYSDRLAAWQRIYDRDGRRWGELPSLSAHLGLADICATTQRNGALLELGCGYGRDAVLFRMFMPEIAIDLIDIVTPGVADCVGARRSVTGDVLQLDDYICDEYQTIFGNYFFHLFTRDEAKAALAQARRVLMPEGILIGSVVAKADRRYGHGQHLGDDCFVQADGVLWRFWSEAELGESCRAVGLQMRTLEAISEVELLRGESDLVSTLYFVAERSR